MKNCSCVRRRRGVRGEDGRADRGCDDNVVRRFAFLRFFDVDNFEKLRTRISVTNR